MCRSMNTWLNKITGFAEAYADYKEKFLKMLTDLNSISDDDID